LPYKVDQFRAGRGDLLYALALPDTFREVTPVWKKLARLKQMQRRRI
jgi:hypothetical protein